MIKDKDKMVVTETRPMGVSSVPYDHAHERRDVNIKALLYSIGGLAVVCALVMVFCAFYFDMLEGSRQKQDIPASPVMDTNAIPPAPRLQPSPPQNLTEVQDMAAMRKIEDSLLHSYGWAQRDSGVARIPIDSAISILARRGTTGAKAGSPISAAQQPDTAAGARGGAGVTDSVRNTPSGKSLEPGNPGNPPNPNSGGE